jgi:hypothetical protein
MKRASEAFLLLTITALMCSGWFIAGYMVAEIEEDLAYDKGLSDGKAQEKAYQEMVAAESTDEQG